MPDHIHLIIWPYGQAKISAVMRDYKEFTAKRIILQAEVEGITAWSDAFRRAGAETGRSVNKVWQDSYWDENVYSAQFLRQKLDYVHENPVRRGLVKDPAAYPYSSFRNYMLDEQWLIEIDRDWF